MKLKMKIFTKKEIIHRILFELLMEIFHQLLVCNSGTCNVQMDFRFLFPVVILNSYNFTVERLKFYMVSKNGTVLFLK